MKQLINNNLLLMSIFFILSCSSNERKSALFEEHARQQGRLVEGNTEQENIGHVIAITHSSIKDSPTGKWVGSFHYGEELEVLEEKIEGEKIFLKVITKQGREGWTSDMYIAKNAKIGVIIKDSIDVFENPTPIDGAKFKVQQGDVFIITKETTNNFHQFFGKEKEKTGWIKSGFSFDPLEIELGTKRQEIIDETNEEKRQILINKLKENTAYQKSSIYIAILIEFDAEKKVIVDENTVKMNDVLEKIVEKAKTNK